MTAEEQKSIRTFVEAVAVATITQPSIRDKQQAPGPSDLANNCDVCVAKKIAYSLNLGAHPRNGFSLKAWIGTAVHEKLERDLPRVYPHAEGEITVKIGHIPGIGPVEGHVDVYLPRKRSIVDWKTSDLDKIKGYKNDSGPGVFGTTLTPAERAELEELKARDRVGELSVDPEVIARLSSLMVKSEEHSGSVPSEYLGQTMLYLFGLRAMGRAADYAILVFIPRDSNNVEDIWVASCRYRPEVAEAVIRRAAHLAKLVRTGQTGDLKPDPKCFPCVIRPRLSR